MQLEKYLAVLRRPIACVIVDQALYSVTTFVTGVLLARTLSTSDYGIYVLAVTLVLMILGVQRALVSVPYTVRRAKHESNELGAYGGSVLLHELTLLTICAIVCLVLLAFARSGALNAPMMGAFALAVVGVLFRDFVRAFLLSSLNVGRVLRIGIAVNVLQLAMLALLAGLERLAPTSAFVVIGACSAVPALLVYWRSAPISFDRTRFARDFAANFKLGRWIVGSSLLFALGTQSYAWLLALFGNGEAVAVFGVASFLAGVLNPLQQAITAYLLPAMTVNGAGSRKEDVVRGMYRAVICLGALYAAWLLVGALFGERLLTAVYSDRYAGSGAVLLLLIASAFVSAITAPVNTALDALERPDVSFRTLAAGLAVTVVCGTLATVKWGVHGAALGVLLSNAATCVLRWRAVTKLLSSRSQSD
jgi:O-antigen/teichoic acid export membrane protein